MTGRTLVTEEQKPSLIALANSWRKRPPLNMWRNFPVGITYPTQPITWLSNERNKSVKANLLGQFSKLPYGFTLKWLDTIARVLTFQMGNFEKAFFTEVRENKQKTETFLLTFGTTVLSRFVLFLLICLIAVFSRKYGSWEVSEIFEL